MGCVWSDDKPSPNICSKWAARIILLLLLGLVLFELYHRIAVPKPVVRITGRIEQLNLGILDYELNKTEEQLVQCGIFAGCSIDQRPSSLNVKAATESWVSRYEEWHNAGQAGTNPFKQLLEGDPTHNRCF